MVNKVLWSEEVDLIRNGTCELPVNNKVRRSELKLFISKGVFFEDNETYVIYNLQWILYRRQLAGYELTAKFQCQK